MGDVFLEGDPVVMEEATISSLLRHSQLSETSPLFSGDCFSQNTSSLKSSSSFIKAYSLSS